MPDETIWQSRNGAWDDPSSWTLGVPDAVSEPTVAKLADLSNMSVRTGLTGASAARLIVTPEYSGVIGSPGQPLELSTAGGITVLRGLGATYIKFASGVFSIVVCDSANLANAGILDGEIARLGVKRGKWTIASTADLTWQVLVAGALADLTIKPIATTEAAPNYIVTTAGRLHNERDSGPTGYVLVPIGGDFLQTGLLDDNDAVIRGLGGLFRYEPATEPVTAPEMILAGGLSDFRGSSYTFPVSRLIIGPEAEIEGTTLEGGGYPPGSLSAPLDLREDYP